MAIALSIEAAESLAKNWSRLDWDNLQIRIEEEVKAIGLRQDDGDEGKRLLLQESTSFRENTDKVLRKKAVPLIKAFQAEVDRLTIRSKAAESFVIDLCRSLTALPDPSVYLGQLKTLIIKAQKLKNCEEEVCRLQSQISDLHNEYADLQNQELTVRSLREQIRNLEAEFELSVQKALKDFEKQQKLEVDAVKKEMDEKLEELEAENKKLRAEVADLEATSREAKDAVSNMRLKLEQREAMDDENLDIVSSDLEKAVYRAIQAEQEVLRLREEIEKMKENTTLTDSAVGNSALMRSKDNQIRKLLDENKKLVTRLSEEADEANKRIDNLTHQLGEQAETVKRLEAKLQAQSDYDEIKRELCVLRNVEFGEEVNSGEVSDNGVVSVATATAEIHSGGHLRALDELLVDKNHKLQNENAALRMRNNNIEEQLDDCKRNGAVREAEINRLQSLVSRLENDLAAVNPVSALHSSRKISGDAPENEEDSAASLLASELDGSADSQKLNNSKNMLSIVLAQRDRLKIRVKDLESSIIEDREQKAFLESELEKAHQDNVQLYGKIKFLQNYRLNQQNNSTLQVDMNDVETRYKDEYERHIDPFKKFNAQERQRKYAQLKPYDKAALHLGRWVMSSGQSRAIFMFYLIFLHLLVFLVLYRFAYTESCQHDFRTDCIANFRNHMNRFHPGAPSEI